MRVEARMLTRLTGCFALGLALASAAPVSRAAEQPPRADPQLADLLGEAVANNPVIAAARNERDAARQRIAPAGALEDPMFEYGVINAPLDPLSLSREDMTMRMLGLSQKLPYPGKRDLRRAVATADAEGLDLAVQEVINKLVRDIRVAYAELAFNLESQRIVARTRTALEHLVVVAGARYNVGQAAQNDVLDAQTELERLQVELLDLTRENTVLQSEMRRLLGRTGQTAPVHVAALHLAAGPALDMDSGDLAIENRPQLLALEVLVERRSRSLDLARQEYYPDFEVKFAYGLREAAPDGVPRDDMVSLTVSLNLPIWRKSRLAPQVAEARAMRAEAQSMLMAQQLETRAAVEQQLAVVAQTRQAAALYQNSLLPQIRATVTSALAAYRVGSIDFLTLRQAQLREFEVSTDLAEAIATHNKAVAEIDLLVGRSVP